MNRQGLRVVVFQKLPGLWVARGLEHDLAVEGRTVNAVLERICELVRAHADFDLRHGRVPLSCFPAAPRLFWQVYARATPLAREETRAFGPIELALNLDRDPVRSLIGKSFQAPATVRSRRLARPA